MWWCCGVSEDTIDQQAKGTIAKVDRWSKNASSKKCEIEKQLRQNNNKRKQIDQEKELLSARKVELETSLLEATQKLKKIEVELEGLKIKMEEIDKSEQIVNRTLGELKHHEDMLIGHFLSIEKLVDIQDPSATLPLLKQSTAKMSFTADGALAG